MRPDIIYYNMNYNRLFNTNYVSDNSDDDNNDNSDNDDIRPLCDVPSTHTTLLSDIIQHPYIDNLPFNIKELTSCVGQQRIIVYRINKYGENNVVEFHLNGDFLSVELNSADDILRLIQSTLQELPGVKRLKGNLYYEGIHYLFVQVRDNHETTSWLTIWDIIVNKQYFGKKLNKYVVDFFTRNSEVSNLIKGSSSLPCSKPVILYTNIDEQYIEYVRRTRNIQYCQREKGTLIKLRKFKEDDNIRTVCFIEDREFSNSYSNLMNTEYVIMPSEEEQEEQEEEPIWIFKNERNIFSYVK